MNINFSGTYKSIDSFFWVDIPKLVVITGPNGSGKTQLLELIYESLTADKPLAWAFEIDNQYSHEEVTFLKNDWDVKNLSNIDIASIQSQHRTLWARAFSTFQKPGVNNSSNQYRESEATRREYQDFAQSIGKKFRYEVTYEEFSKKYPKEILTNNTPVNQQLNKIFFNYRISEIELSAKGLSKEEIISNIGEKPWDVLRNIISVSKLPFEINDPSSCGLWDSFELKLTHSVTQQLIKFQDLSSGEKIIISLIFYLYQSQERNIFPKLILMDEPDAHLHPSMTQMFLNIVKDIFVTKFDIQVFITTHSPSTVVLTPEKSLFEMSINSPRIQPSISKNNTIGVLTSGLVYVGTGTKYFLVEDQADVDFYNYVNGQLITQNIISTNIPLVFIKASTNDTTGGKSVVNSWVEKLCSSGLTNVIHGLIDKDSGNPTGNGIYAIDRYSIENYLVDPLVIYSALLEKEANFEIKGIKLSLGEEYKLKLLPSDELQYVIESICSKMEASAITCFGPLKTNKIRVDYINGVSVLFPSWLLEFRGKTILNKVCNETFGSKINYGSLFKAFKRLNLIPQDLARKLAELQRLKVI